MSIISKLSSQIGEKGNSANHEVANLCISDLSLLEEILPGLSAKDAKLVADCAEVFTEVAKENPEALVKYSTAIMDVLKHKNNRARWEATHCIALIAEQIPDQIQSRLTFFDESLQSDKSLIVRGYVIEILGNYALTSKTAAEDVYPILKKYIESWEGKHINHILIALMQVVESLPEISSELKELAEKYKDHKKPGIKKSARKLIKMCGL